MDTSLPTTVDKPRERHRRSGLGVSAKIFLSTVGIVVLAIGGAVAWTSMRADALMQKGVRATFASTQATFENIERARFDKLTRLNALVAEDPTFRAVILDTDEATQHDDLLRRKESLGADLVIVTDAAGAQMARSDATAGAGKDLSAWPLVAKAQEGDAASGLLAEGGSLYHAVALPIGAGGEELAGVLISGYLLDDRLAAELKQTTGTEVAFVSEQGGKPALVASTLAAPDQIASVLAFSAAAAATDSPEPRRLEVGPDSYLGVARPLATPAGERAGSLLVFRSIALELATFRELRRNILLIGLAALVVAMIVSYLVASRMAGPLVSLARVAESVTDGKYDVEVPAAGGDEVGALSAAIRAMVSELKGKAELERYLAEISLDETHVRNPAAAAAAAAHASSTKTGGREPVVGEIFAGRYEILEMIGAGGMGSVYKARDRELDDVVALKTIRKDAVGASPEVLERFKQEIKLARKATHKNILRTYDFGDAGGVAYLTMEYVKGYTLRELVRTHPDVPLGIALRIARQTCVGLHVAHQAGVIHRDVKSQNILVQPNGELKIMDFGIARPVEATGLTATGAVLGTPEFIAPEQAVGKPADARSDLYSAGCVFYELFGGAPPFTGGGALEMLMRHVNEEPKPLRAIRPSVPPEIEAIVAKMIRKNPADRFQSLAEVHAALGKVPVPASTKAA